MSNKKKIKRIIKERLDQGPKISTAPSNFEQALFQDIDGLADDLWHKAMIEMFPHLKVEQTIQPDDQAKKD